MSSKRVLFHTAILSLVIIPNCAKISSRSLLNFECPLSETNECASYPSSCDCSESELNCQVCNTGSGCSQCSDGYFTIGSEYKCISCTIFENCQFCQNGQGCGQCNNDCTRTYDESCGLYYCDCGTTGGDDDDDDDDDDDTCVDTINIYFATDPPRNTDFNLEYGDYIFDDEYTADGYPIYSQSNGVGFITYAIEEGTTLYLNWNLNNGIDYSYEIALNDITDSTNPFTGELSRWIANNCCELELRGSFNDCDNIGYDIPSDCEEIITINNIYWFNDPTIDFSSYYGEYLFSGEYDSNNTPVYTQSNGNGGEIVISPLNDTPETLRIEGSLGNFLSDITISEWTTSNPIFNNQPKLWVIDNAGFANITGQFNDCSGQGIDVPDAQL